MEMSQHSQIPAIAVLDKASERQRRMGKPLLSNNVIAIERSANRKTSSKLALNRQNPVSINAWLDQVDPIESRQAARYGCSSDTRSMIFQLIDRFGDGCR